jgi:putative endonuclease
MRAKGGYFYIVSNPHRTTLYIGVTDSLRNRSWQHKNGEGSKFTKKYNCTDLVYFECFEDIESAISREKQVKTWKRAWKEALIKSVNPEMRDLYDDVEGYD